MTKTLRETLELIDQFTTALAAGMDDAAAHADVEMVLETKRGGDAKELLAAELAQALIRDGWVVSAPGAVESVPVVTITAPSAAPVRHELLDDGQGTPMCLCGKKWVPPEVTTRDESRAMVEAHVAEEAQKRGRP